MQSPFLSTAPRSARLRGLRGAMATCARGALYATLTVGIVPASAGPFFDEHAVAVALSPTLPATMSRAASETATARTARTPVRMITQAALPPTDSACPALLRHTFNRLQNGEAQSLCQP